jgi:hypothetical protein
MELAEVDPEVAAVAFATDLDRLWAGGRPEQRGWKRTPIDPLTEIVEMPARLVGGGEDSYLLRLEAGHYGPHPPAVKFVEPGSWDPAGGGSRWFPRLEAVPGWFGLHATYDYEDGSKAQLVCFSFNLDYYISGHNPQTDEVWAQGRHTVAATLNRIHEILGPEYYRGPAAPQAEAA